MVAKLDQLGAPVKLAIGLDSVFRTRLSGRVGRYVNFYIANGAGDAGREDRAIPGQAREYQCAERAWRRAHVHRKEPDHAAEGDKRDRRRRLRPICTIFGGAEAATAWSGKRGETWHGKHRGGTPVARLARFQGRRRSDECRKFCQFLDDRSSAEPLGGVAAGIAVACLRPKSRDGKRMSNPTQVAAVVIWATLSACIFSPSCNLALAGPVARSTAAAATTAPVAPPAATQPQARVYLFRGALGSDLFARDGPPDQAPRRSRHPG